MNLTGEQSSILSQQEGSFRIIAAAGSGKTTTLTLYVRDAMTVGMNDKEIAFITFTRLASHEIKTKIRNLIGLRTNICCGTFHRVMFRFMREASIDLPTPINLFDGCMDHNVEFVLSQMRSPSPRLLTLLQTYKLLVVDEFQDLDPPQFEFITLFKRIQPDLRIIAIGDMAQNIYRFRGTSNEFLRRLLQSEIVPDLKTFTLTTNFRSSGAILGAVNSIFAEEIRGGHILPMVAAKPGGQKPRYYEYTKTGEKGYGVYEETVVKTLVPIIKEAKAVGKSIALIFPVIKCQSFEIIDALFKSYLPTVDFHRIAKEDATSAVVEITYDVHAPSSPIQYSTFHASKGLEWDIVALINVSDDVYTLRPGEVEDEAYFTEKTNLLYVGMTRPKERLLVFANANQGGRHRLIARLGEGLETVMDTEVWGEEVTPKLPERSVAQIGVSDLVKRVLQHPDIYARIMACSERIAATFHRGDPLKLDNIYEEMKKRNRELAFGTFIDRMVKRALTHEPTLQCRILEILGYMNHSNWFHKEQAKANIEVLISVIDQFFERAGNMPNMDPMAYIPAVRFIAAFRSKTYNMTDALRSLYSSSERRIMTAYKKSGSLDIRDEYILSQAYNLYAKGHMSEISAVDAPEDSYKGLPAGFDEFAAASVMPAAGIIRLASHASVFRADIPVETESLIRGEIDLLVGDDGILEIKCGAATSMSDLRGTSSCSNLLQLLAYVALARHGTLPIPRLTWGMLINPLTATWERYDLTTWLPEQSLEFLDCLKELQLRG